MKPNVDSQQSIVEKEVGMEISDNQTGQNCVQRAFALSNLLCLSIMTRASQEMNNHAHKNSRSRWTSCALFYSPRRLDKSV